jgi:hypothetical protein
MLPSFSADWFHEPLVIYQVAGGVYLHPARLAED